MLTWIFWLWGWEEGKNKRNLPRNLSPHFSYLLISSLQIYNKTKKKKKKKSEETWEAHSKHIFNHRFILTEKNRGKKGAPFSISKGKWVARCCLVWQVLDFSPPFLANLPLLSLLLLRRRLRGLNGLSSALENRFLWEEESSCCLLKPQQSNQVLIWPL